MTTRHEAVLALSDADSRFVDVDGSALHFKRAGSGPTVLLLHGSGSSLHCWEHVTPPLARAADMVSVDLPGFGLSAPPDDHDFHIAAFSRRIRLFAAELGLQDIVLVGNSLGGNIAWNVALDAPDLIRGLVLINATGFPGKSLPLPMRLARHRVGRRVLGLLSNRNGVERNLRGIVGPGSAAVVTPDFVDRVFAMMSIPGNRDAFIEFCRADQPDRTEALSAITAPTLVLRSASIDGQHFTSRIPNAVERVHPDTGHLMPDEDPAWVAAEIAEFLTRLTADERSND
ncbi:alpha/beta fold hydrolase [Microbacterium fluvii]|uniref:Alpha/beta fold hydrolase n=1 Tax=Microbacterium fluvii TaxID=415215 RepID=A0ABW2HAY3_9MICO|nr:alpha/beta hydrolase [Microbacterium fluvii]MCU4671816.1 alpha/beta hydrolase [Microbacterium fluvii]